MNLIELLSFVFILIVTIQSDYCDTVALSGQSGEFDFLRLDIGYLLESLNYENLTLADFGKLDVFLRASVD